MLAPTARGSLPQKDSAQFELALRVIGECTLFRGLGEEARMEAASVALVRDAVKGEVLFREGEPVRAFGVLVRGRVRLARGASGTSITFVQMVGPTEACDWPGMLADERHAATAVAAEPSRVLLWHRHFMDDLCDHQPVLYRNALAILARQQRDLAERYREFTALQVHERLARALLRLAGPKGRWLEDGSLEEIPVSRKDLAHVAGTTLFTLNRLLIEWEARGLIETGRERVRLTNPNALAAIGRFPGDIV